MFAKLFEDRKIGFYLSFFASIAAIFGSIGYVLVYQLTAANEVDRVFNWMTFGFMLLAGIAGVITEISRLSFGPILVTLFLSVAFASHVVEFAYPMADAITGVPFFGGNFHLALVFTSIFGAVTIIQVISTFMEQNNDRRSK